MIKDLLINEDTIALVKDGNKTIIYDYNNIRVINHHIKRVLEYNCSYYGSSLEGRKEAAKKILNIKYKVPIVIENNHNLILIQTGDFRAKECVFIVLNKIVSYEEENNLLKINCINDTSFTLNISKYSFEKMLLNSLRLSNILKYRKITNLV